MNAWWWSFESKMRRYVVVQSSYQNSMFIIQLAAYWLWNICNFQRSAYYDVRVRSTFELVTCVRPSPQPTTNFSTLIVSLTISSLLCWKVNLLLFMIKMMYAFWESGPYNTGCCTLHTNMIHASWHLYICLHLHGAYYTNPYIFRIQ